MIGLPTNDKVMPDAGGKWSDGLRYMRLTSAYLSRVPGSFHFLAINLKHVCMHNWLSESILRRFKFNIISGEDDTEVIVI